MISFNHLDSFWFKCSLPVTLLDFDSSEYDDFGQKDCFDKILLQAEIMLCTQRYMGVPEAMKAKRNPTPEEGASFCR